MDPRRASRAGEGVTLAALAEDPYPILARLREADAAVWVPETAMWFVCGYDDAVRVLRDPETFRTDSPRSPIRDVLGEHMLTTEGPRQHRYKRKCMPAYTAVAVRDHAAAEIRRKAETLIERFAGAGRVDLRAAFARELALHIAAHVLGFPEGDESRLSSWYDAFAEALANFLADPRIRAAGMDAAGAFRAHVASVLERLEAGPGPSLLSSLAADGEDRLARDEIVANAAIILFGGVETAESLILNAVWALLSDADALALARADAAVIPGVVEETLRWEPAVQSCTRWAAADVELGSARIRAGDTVQCMTGGANRDPAHFPEPDRFDPRRSNARDHLTFGSGRHFCLGAQLARAETAIALELLLERLPGLRLDDAAAVRPYGYEFRKPARLAVAWG